MLNTFEPMMLPRASWPFFLAAATTQVASSGIEVPPARMVMAMNLSLTPRARASSVALFTNNLPPKASPAMPATISRRHIQTLRCLAGESSSSGLFPLKLRII